MIDLNVLYFAHVRERVGRPQEQLQCPPGTTVGEALELLQKRHPALKALMPVTRVALNGVFVEPAAVIPQGAELVLIPPVSGGGGLDRVCLTQAPLDDARLRALEALVASPSHGATVSFSGTVRDHARGRQVTGLNYEAYEPMARELLAAIVAEAEARFPGVQVAVHHRLGPLTVGEHAVLVVAGSAHRAEAFGACQHVLTRMKEDVPIWKREDGPDGSSWVSERP